MTKPNARRANNVVTFARRLWLHGRVRCALCGKVCAAMIPRGGDGSMVVPARHKDRRVNGTFDYCEGRFMAGIPAEVKR
jgi:hypothetical protein